MFAQRRVTTTYKKRPPVSASLAPRETADATSMARAFVVATALASIESQPVSVDSSDSSDSLDSSDTEDAENKSVRVSSKATKPRAIVKAPAKHPRETTRNTLKPASIADVSDVTLSRQTRKVSLMTARSASKTSQALNSLKASRAAKSNNGGRRGASNAQLDWDSERTFIDRLEDKPQPVEISEQNLGEESFLVVSVKRSSTNSKLRSKRELDSAIGGTDKEAGGGRALGTLRKDEKVRVKPKSASASVPWAVKSSTSSALGSERATKRNALTLVPDLGACDDGTPVEILPPSNRATAYGSTATSLLDELDLETAKISSRSDVTPNWICARCNFTNTKLNSRQCAMCTKLRRREKVVECDLVPKSVPGNVDVLANELTCNKSDILPSDIHYAPSRVQRIDAQGRVSIQADALAETKFSVEYVPLIVATPCTLSDAEAFAGPRTEVNTQDGFLIAHYDGNFASRDPDDDEHSFTVEISRLIISDEPTCNSAILLDEPANCPSNELNKVPNVSAVTSTQNSAILLKEPTNCLLDELDVIPDVSPDPVESTPGYRFPEYAPLRTEDSLRNELAVLTPPYPHLVVSTSKVRQQSPFRSPQGPCSSIQSKLCDSDLPIVITNELASCFVPCSSEEIAMLREENCLKSEQFPVHELPAAVTEQDLIIGNLPLSATESEIAEFQRRGETAGSTEVSVYDSFLDHYLETSVVGKYSEDSIAQKSAVSPTFDETQGKSPKTGACVHVSSEDAEVVVGPLSTSFLGTTKLSQKHRRSFGGSYAQDIMSEMKHEEATLNKLLSVCNQTKPVTFEAALRNYTLERKLGEATFSEVFSFTNESNFRLAVKLMPFGAPKDKYLVNGSPQISVHEVTQEVLITKTMSDFRNHGSTGEDAAGFNFVELVSVHVCQGFYPQELLAAWDDYAQDKDSENDRPDYFPKKQLYAVIVLMNGGTDLEHFKIKPVATAANVLTPLKKSFGVNTKASSAATNKTWAMVRSILTQTILSLAAAERKLKFEHRDLHWGNVLCMAGPQYLYAKTSYFCGEDLGSIQVPLEGVKVTIIDYTLSRCEHGDRLYFNKMDDESFFTGEGDYQFDIYRMMREETDGAWDAFFPKTNLMWIGYLLYKLLKAKSLPHAGSVAKQSRLALAAFRERINGYSDMSALVRVEVALSGGDATKLFFS